MLDTGILQKKWLRRFAKQGQRGVGQWPYIVNYYGHLDKEDPIFGTAVGPLPLSTALSHWSIIVAGVCCDWLFMLTLP